MGTATALDKSHHRRAGANSRPQRRDGGAAVPARRHLMWLGIGLVGSFTVPFVFADQLDLQRDVYYGIHGAGTLALCAAWMRDTRHSLRGLISRRWRLAVGLGLVFAAISVGIALTAEDASSHPSGVQFVGAIAWRGLIYGAIDGLLLSAFPILVVSAALAGSKLHGRRWGKAAVLALALAASLLVTATYHAGYSDFRSSKMRKPVTGDLVWSVPTLATLNPIGAPMAHAGVHVAAVTHSYHTDLFLPPH